MRALIVSYAFPPVGGAGVQRVLKLTKYLPAYGITPSVLTVANPSVPVRDSSLQREVPLGVEVVRVPTLEPSYASKAAVRHASSRGPRTMTERARTALIKAATRLLVPDPQVLWLPSAQWALVQRLLAGVDDVVFISGPPFSQFWLAPVARASRGTAVVLDYRDEWRMASTASRGDAWLESGLLRCAHAVTTATSESRTRLCARFGFLDPERVRAIPNGYDPEDFRDDLPGPTGDSFVLTYMGTTFPLTTARWLIAAVRLLHAREPEIARRLRVRFVGRIVESETPYFDDAEGIGIQRAGYLDHGPAVALLASSHAAVCILDDVTGAESVYPAKIFEIMHLRKPCLVLAPEGALADLVRQHNVGQVVAPRDVPAIATALERMVREFLAGMAAIKSSPVDVERFDRRRQAGEFAGVLHAALAAARRPLTHARRPQDLTACGVHS
jgi:glycosyltransferase involved in cell wall biosynthesis